MSFMDFKKHRYPLFLLASAFVILVFGLVMSKTAACSWFLIGAYVWLFLFGCRKACLRVLPMFFLCSGVFSLIAYLSSGKDPAAALSMANRFGSVFVALIPGMSAEPVAMTRNLSQLHTPRAVTLGMLITLSFVPVLKTEIRRVREAMRTRGAGRWWNPQILYRAFLIPLVTRLVDISDTLTLSVETRRFTLEKANYTVYKRETVNLFDLLYLFGLLAGMGLAVML